MYELITLNNLLNGAVEEKFQYELKKVMDNISDINTDFDKLREIEIKVKLKPDENREKIDIIVNIKSKVAPLKESKSVLSFVRKEGKMGMFQDNSTTMPLFPDDKKENEINFKEVING